MRAQASHKRHRPDKRPATNTTDLATERPRRHTRCQIGPEGAKSVQKAPKHLTRRAQSAAENRHRPATSQPHARQGAQAKAEATQATHDSKRANMKKTHEKPHKNPEDFLRKWHRVHELNSLGKPLARPCENDTEVPMKTISMTEIFNSVPI